MTDPPQGYCQMVCQIWYAYIGDCFVEVGDDEVEVDGMYLDCLTGTFKVGKAMP